MAEIERSHDTVSSNHGVIAKMFRHKMQKNTAASSPEVATDKVAQEGSTKEGDKSGGLRLPEEVNQKEDVVSPDEGSGSELS